MALAKDVPDFFTNGTSSASARGAKIQRSSGLILVLSNVHIAEKVSDHNSFFSLSMNEGGESVELGGV